jgi:hypothetical protein
VSTLDRHGLLLVKLLDGKGSQLVRTRLKAFMSLSNMMYIHGKIPSAGQLQLAHVGNSHLNLVPAPACGHQSIPSSCFSGYRKLAFPPCQTLTTNPDYAGPASIRGCGTSSLLVGRQEQQRRKQHCETRHMLRPASHWPFPAVRRATNRPRLRQVTLRLFKMLASLDQTRPSRKLAGIYSSAQNLRPWLLR